MKQNVHEIADRRDPSNNPPGMCIHIHRVVAQETDEGDAGALGQLDGEAGRGGNGGNARDASQEGFLDDFK
jgi:hypothetical protein